MIGVGDYKLCKEFQYLLQCPDNIRIPDFYDPQEIVYIARNSIKELPKTEMCSEKVPCSTSDTCTQKTILTEGNYENVSINNHLQDENTQSDIESILNFTDIEMFGISTSIYTIDSTSPTPVLNSTASLIETKGTNSQYPNVHDT